MGWPLSWTLPSSALRTMEPWQGESLASARGVVWIWVCRQKVERGDCGTGASSPLIPLSQMTPPLPLAVDSQVLKAPKVGEMGPLFPHPGPFESGQPNLAGLAGTADPSPVGWVLGCGVILQSQTYRKSPAPHQGSRLAWRWVFCWLLELF